MSDKATLSFQIPDVFNAYKNVYVSLTCASNFTYVPLKSTLEFVVHDPIEYKHKISVLMFYEKKKPEVKGLLSPSDAYVFEPVAVCYLTVTREHILPPLTQRRSKQLEDTSNEEWTKLKIVKCESTSEKADPWFSDEPISCTCTPPKTQGLYKYKVMSAFKSIDSKVSGQFALQLNKHTNEWLQSLDLRFPSGDGFNGTFFTERVLYTLRCPVHVFYYLSGACAPLPSSREINEVVDFFCVKFHAFAVDTNNDDKLYRVADVLQFVLAHLLPYRPDRNNYPHSLTLQPNASLAQADCEDKTAYAWYLFRLFSAYTGNQKLPRLLQRSCKKAMFLPTLVTTETSGSTKNGVHAVGLLVPFGYENTREWCCVDGMSNVQTNANNIAMYKDMAFGEYKYSSMDDDFVNTSMRGKSHGTYGDVVYVCIEEDNVINTFALLHRKKGGVLKKLSFRELLNDGVSRKQLRVKPIFEDKEDKYTSITALQNAAKEFVQRTEHITSLVSASNT